MTWSVALTGTTWYTIEQHLLLVFVPWPAWIHGGSSCVGNLQLEDIRYHDFHIIFFLILIFIFIFIFIITLLIVSATKSPKRVPWLTINYMIKPTIMVAYTMVNNHGCWSSNNHHHREASVEPQPGISGLIVASLFFGVPVPRSSTMSWARFCPKICPKT